MALRLMFRFVGAVLIPIRISDPPDPARRDRFYLLFACAERSRSIHTNSPRRSSPSSTSTLRQAQDSASSAHAATQRPARPDTYRIVLRMFHPAGGENSGASLAGSVMRNGITWQRSDRILALPRFQVARNVLEVFRSDLRLVEARHYAQSVAHLETLHETG